MKPKTAILFFFFLTFIVGALAYPIDGYLFSGIRRLLRLELIEKGELKGRKLPEGAKKSIKDIKLHLHGTAKGDSLAELPEVDADFQKALNRILPNLHDSYGITVLDISPDQPIRYAKRKETRGYQPGSVGKLAVISALFCELQNLEPYSFEKRIELMKKKQVKAGGWAIYDEHTVPFFDPETNKYFRRQVQKRDTFSLFEWADHMMSVSNNGAASVVWREAILMRVFGEDYPELTFDESEEYFNSTPRAELAELAISVVSDPLRSLGISKDDWRLGRFFTRGAGKYIPGKGGSIGTPEALMKWLVAMERGDLVDPKSSLEIKRLMFMTGNRIRYASNSKLKDAAVYFKSGSLYKCNRETMPDCGKYRGNVVNYMNSVAIVERGDSVVYLVALMTNVLKKNSNRDHNALAGRIDKMVMSFNEKEKEGENEN